MTRQPVGRREFITLVGGAAIGWPSVAQAQQQRRPVIGFLHVTSPEGRTEQLSAFEQGLKQSGYVAGENVTFENRSADNQLDRLPRLAADLVRQRVAVIVANTAPAITAAKSAT